MLTPRFAFLAFLAAAVLPIQASAQINTVQTVVPGVYFHEGDPRRGHSNNGWVIFEDYVVLIDANYPSGAKLVLPRIKETSDKPVRFVFDTHHHADHAYGNQFWADQGAVLITNTGALAEMRRREPADWQARAKTRPDVAESRLKLPSVVFPEEMDFDDGHARLELRWFGPGHTAGDSYAWLPKEKVLFTGDACVNGPYNNVRDGNIGEWIKTLERVKQLGAEKVCPGHGPMGGPEIIVDQQAYFIALVREITALHTAGRTPAEAKAAVETIGTSLKQDARVARYVPAGLAGLTGHVEKVWTELGGAPFPP